MSIFLLLLFTCFCNFLFLLFRSISWLFAFVSIFILHVQLFRSASYFSAYISAFLKLILHFQFVVQIFPVSTLLAYFLFSFPLLNISLTLSPLHIFLIFLFYPMLSILSIRFTLPSSSPPFLLFFSYLFLFFFLSHALSIFLSFSLPFVS